jgi:hypothetical protein
MEDDLEIESAGHSKPDASIDLAFAQWLARETSRRSFVKKLLKGAFLVGASGALMGSVFTETARAHHVCVDPGDSPYCPITTCCNSSTKNCKNTSSCKGRPYRGSTCQSTGGCWTEYEQGKLWKCCDCCTTASVGGQSCTGCGGGTWQRCVCEFDTGISAPSATPVGASN